MTPTLSRLLLSLCLLLPALSWAGPDARPPSLADAPAPSESSEAPLRVAAPEQADVPGTQETWREASARPGQGLRILAEVGGGLGGGLAGTAVGFGLGLLACVGQNTYILSCFLETTLGAALGGAVGLSVGVWLGGKLARGTGTLLSTLVGCGLGVVAASLVLTFISNSTLGLVSLVALPFIGAVTAYELSDSWNHPSAPRASRGPRLHPVLAATSGGGMIGLGGRF